MNQLNAGDASEPASNTKRQTGHEKNARHILDDVLSTDHTEVKLCHFRGSGSKRTVQNLKFILHVQVYVSLKSSHTLLT